jgi:hypothetical protein
MKAGHQNEFAAKLETTRREREEIAAQMAALRSRHDALLVREERFRCEAEAQSVQPYLLRAPALREKLDLSPDGFERLRRNEAKDFPKPIYGIDSQPRWNWSEVKDWLDGQRGA